ncbi:MAG: glycogen debranching enzyme, partial [Abditibacteriota bacterium]|nr:glycogen debranching enzyme [Abditibacteriota bacterium]
MKEKISCIKIRPGDHSLPGVTKTASGYNVTVTTPAAKCSLVLLRDGEETVIPMDAYACGDSRSILAEGPDMRKYRYAFRLEGFPEGSPCSDGLYGDIYAKRLCTEGGPRGVFAKTESASFDWKGDRFPRIPMKDAIVYEAHVKGFTKTAKTAFPGTFRGLQSRIGYLKALGINALELLPVFEFDHLEPVFKHPETGEAVRNYWGYATTGFFAPKASYAAGKNPSAELKRLVRALHKNGIELWLDVVFNHTGGKPEAPVLAAFGDYYLFKNGKPADLTGCGNTVACGRPEALRFIVRCLEYWRSEYHIDGFRFDLCSVLARNEKGENTHSSPLLSAINASPAVKGCKLIAEPWDAADGYRPGWFSANYRWSEWNDRFRDTLRSFLTGRDGAAAAMAECIAGSPGLFPKRPEASVNFAACHDGFTLYDLFAYKEKHNEANGENNRDGSDNNISVNMGTEGPADGETEKKRRRYAAAALALVLLSRGVPMLLMGDEVLRTKRGNNNTWCRDDELSSLPWEQMKARRDTLHLTKRLIALRKACPFA